MDKKKTRKISAKKLIKKKKIARHKRTKKIIEDIRKEIDIDLDKVYVLNSDSIDNEQDYYCYTNTNILKNELGIKDREHLIQVEKRVVMLKMYILREKMRNEFLEYDYSDDCKKIFKFKKDTLESILTVERYMLIHKKMFDELYSFAGEFRTVNMSKDTFVFAGHMFIQEQAENIFKEMNTEFIKLLVANENILSRNKINFKKKEINIKKKQLKQELARLLTKYLADLNVLHPFREGNGRATREVFREIAYIFGYLFTLKNIPTEEFMNAMKKSVYDNSTLNEIVYRSLYER
ncbi:MAG: Fic/DOC family protein [Clostridium sp.]